jgi:hypothetical protein
MKVEMLTRYDLTNEEVEYLWNHHVSLDDWDYMLIVDSSELLSEGRFDVSFAYPLERLLTGCCDNIWYVPIRFRNQICAIGVAYHA